MTFTILCEDSDDWITIGDSAESVHGKSQRSICFFVGFLSVKIS